MVVGTAKGIERFTAVPGLVNLVTVKDQDFREDLSQILVVFDHQYGAHRQPLAAQKPEVHTLHG